MGTRTRRRLQLFGAIVLTLISLGLLAYVEIGIWQECRAAGFSWWYCMRMISA